MLYFYKLLTILLTPLVPLWLWLRARRGKEDKGRINERFGRSVYARPKGRLLWIHAASVGEANSVLVLIKQVLEKFPQVRILLTTGTVSSAELMKKLLPPGVIHQYTPVDTPEATERFMRHWLPDIGWFVESELWPNLLAAASRYHCLMTLINARMSPRSFRLWQKIPQDAARILGYFSCCFPQSAEDAQRLKLLGAKQIISSGNLKYDAPTLSCQENLLVLLHKACEKRHIWLAASTHNGEEEIIGAAHAMLASRYPDLLTIIVPRHPARGGEIAINLEKYGKCFLRSQQQIPPPEAAFYIVDSLGELGLFYRLAEIVFIGGSLIKHGGHNPLEAARLSCCILSGSHIYNFKDIYEDLQLNGATIRVNNAGQLSAQIDLLLATPQLRTDMQARAKQLIERKSGSAKTIMELFAPLFTK